MRPVSMTALLLGGPKLIRIDSASGLEILVRDEPKKSAEAELSGTRPAEMSDATQI